MTLTNIRTLRQACRGYDLGDRYGTNPLTKAQYARFARPELVATIKAVDAGRTSFETACQHIDDYVADYIATTYAESAAAARFESMAYGPCD